MEGLSMFAGISTFAVILMIVFGLLQIILFFKLWGMTNDIKIIKNELLSTFSKNQKQNSKNDVIDESKFEIGALVININKDKQMRIKDYDPFTGKFSCYSQGGMVYEGDFDESELKLF